MPRRLASRLASGTLVLLFHALILAALTITMSPRNLLEPEHITQVYLRPEPNRPQPTMRNLVGPPRMIYVPQIPEPHIDIAPEYPPASSLEGIGRALFACGMDSLAILTAEERTHCSYLSVERTRPPRLRLGPGDAVSPFAQAIATRNAPIVPMEHVCAPQESLNANLGFPCYTFPRAGH